MDINDLRSAVTVIGLLLFVALVVWVYRAPRRRPSMPRRGCRSRRGRRTA